MVAVDYAFANTTRENQKNDNTIIICFSGLWKGNRFERRLEYIEGHEASDSIGAADRARELFWLYHADYLIPDLRNGGEVLFNRMGMPLEFGDMVGIPYLNGLTISDKSIYQVVTDAKLIDLSQRTIDKNAIHCIIPFVGGTEINSFAWIELKKQLEVGNIKFLTSVQDRQELLEDNGSYFKMTSEEIAKDLVPYGQTDLLIQEAVNLKTEYRNDKIKLTEPRNGTKDRIVILSYANYIMTLIENEWLKQQQQGDTDWEEFNLIY